MMNDVETTSIDISNMSPAELSVLQNKITKRQISNIDQRVKVLEEETPIRPYQNKQLEKERKRKVVKILGGYSSKAYKNKEIRSDAFQQIMREYRDKFGVTCYQDTNKKDLPLAISFYANWIPDDELRRKIEAENGELQIIDGGA